MATLETEILRLLGDESQRFWTEGATDYITEAIAVVCEMAGRDALRDLVDWHVITADGATYAFVKPSDELLPLWLEVDESDGEYRVWAQVTNAVLRARREEEQSQLQDASAYRCWTWGRALQMFDANGNAISYVSFDLAPTGYELYPTPEDDRTIRLAYIAEGAEGTISAFLKKAVKEHAVSVMATKKGRDFDLADRYERKWRQTVADIRLMHQQRYGLGGTVLGTIERRV